MPHIQIDHSSYIKYKIDYILFNNLITILTLFLYQTPQYLLFLDISLIPQYNTLYHVDRSSYIELPKYSVT